jgi:hypothetical protein
MADTVTVRRGGSYLTIPFGAIERYKAKGYDVVDEKGNVIQSSTPNDVNILKRAYEEHVEEIKRLKAEIAELKSKPKPEPIVISKPELESEVVKEIEPAEKKTTAKRAKKSV